MELKLCLQSLILYKKQRINGETDGEVEKQTTTHWNQRDQQQKYRETDGT